MKNFIAFEGKEKVGKTTIAKEVCKLLPDYKYMKFPNEENIFGKVIREILQKKMVYEAYGFQALNALNKQWVHIDGNTIADRYILSQKIYGRLAGLSEEFLELLEVGLPKPTLTFVFTGDSFTNDTEIFGEQNSIIDELYEEFLYLNKNNYKVIRIDVNKSKEDTVDEVIEYIYQFGY